MDDYKAAFLVAEAGYGKTTLVADALAHLLVPAVWYRLGPGDDRLACFVGYLLEIVRLHAPDFGARTECELRDALVGDKEDLAALFVHDLSAYPLEPVCLVLDGLDAVACSPAVMNLVGALLEFSPDNLHLVVTARARPRLPLDRLLASGRLLELTAADLAFTEHESRVLLSDTFGGDPAADDARFLHAATEGWAAGLVLASEGMSRERGPAPRPDDGSLPQAARDAVFRYLGSEVFDRVDEPTRRFLWATSFLRTLDADVCAELTGGDPDPEHLAHLEQQGLFLRRVDDTPGHYRFHLLFQAFLQAQRSPAQAAAMHARTAAVLERRGDWSGALEHYCAADLHEDAARFIEQVGEKLIDLGQIDRVVNWFQYVPDETLAARPWCVALRGRISQRKTDYVGAARLFRRAEQMFAERGDADGQTWVRCELALVDALRGDWEDAAQDSQALLDLPTTGPAARSHLLSTLAMSRLASGDTDGSIDCARSALEEADRVADDQHRLATRMRALRHLAQAQIYRLRLAQATRSARINLALCEREHASGFWVVWSLWTLGVIRALAGEFEESLAILDRATALHSRLEYRQTELLALWRGMVARALGRGAEAEESFAQAGEDADGEQAMLHLDRHELTRARYLGDATPEVSSGEPRDGREARAAVLRGVLLREQGDLAAARAHLDAAARWFRNARDLLSLVSVLVHLVYVDLQGGETDRATNELREAFGLAAPSGLHHLLWWDNRAVAAACAHALVAGVWPDYAASLAARRLGGEYSAGFMRLLATPGISCREQATAVLRSVLARSSGGSPIADDLLAADREPDFLCRLADDLSMGLLSLDEIARLRLEVGMTWKEILVYSAYYLRPRYSTGGGSEGHYRRQTARRLGISENTLKIHVNSIRHKLGLAERAVAPRQVAGQ